MRLRGRRIPPEVAHAAKVALAASVLVGVVYAACVAVLDIVVTARLTQSVDERLGERLADAQEIGLRASSGDDDDLGTTPVYLWRVTRAGRVAQAGTVTKAGTGAPALPAGLHVTPGTTATIRLPTGKFRFEASSASGVTLIAGQSLASEDHLTALLREGETIVAPVLLLAMFCGALTIGLRALLPVEQSRRRQLEFTADASHELRTPLSVISAETSVALSSPRDPAEYRAVLRRIQGEGARLQRIVEDLLWLARFDSTPPMPTHEPVDLATIAAECAERFSALAATQNFHIQVAPGSPDPAWISAPPEWIDRLAGVLIDNACRYAGSGGLVRVSVGQRGNRVTLTVEDTGPGVAAEHRSRLFDRFHRSTEQGGSAGLGLAIADSIVRTTDGQWQLGDSDLGGALFEVSWRRPATRQAAAHTQPGRLRVRAAASPAGRDVPGAAQLAAGRADHLAADGEGASGDAGPPAAGLDGAAGRTPGDSTSGGSSQVAAT